MWGTESKDMIAADAFWYECYESKPMPANIDYLINAISNHFDLINTYPTTAIAARAIAIMDMFDYISTSAYPILVLHPDIKAQLATKINEYRYTPEVLTAATPEALKLIYALTGVTC